ncbi:MAG: FGGY-family carbohydrate kinase [Cellulosilyticaceae bacterium]
MCKDPLILTFDCGTQSIRALLFNKRGELLAKSKVDFTPYFSEKPGYAEQHPSLYWEKLCHASQALKRNNLDLWPQIIGITVTTMRNTHIPLDKNGDVIRPTIVWLDQREAKCETPLPLKSNVAFEASRMSECVAEQRKGAKANWIRENEPENWKKTYKYIQLSGFMTYKLTGNMSDSVAAQIGHLPFDYKNKTWMNKNNIRYPIFGVEVEKLPDLYEVGTILGKVTEKASEETGILAGTPLVATGSDKGCETLGTGCITPDMASLSFGTTSTMQITSRKYVEPQRFLPAYPAVLPGHYNLEVQIFRGYWMVTWFKKEFAQKELLAAEELHISPEEILNELLAEIPPGSDGLILQPYWGSGLKNPEARGSIIGFSGVHTRAHIYRAIIEGINYGLIDGLKTVEKRAHYAVNKLTVSGGGSQSDGICQITSDMFGLPLYRAQTYETSGLGSSIAGFVGLKEFGSYTEAIGEMVHYQESFLPNAKNHAIYAALYNDVYKNIYNKLKPLYQQIKTLI